MRAAGRERLRSRQPATRLAVVLREDALPLVHAEHFHAIQPAQPIRIPHGAGHKLVLIASLLF